MRLVETCSCGASLELSWEQPKSKYAPQEHFSQASRSEREIKAFRLAHKPCRAAASQKETT